jgi:hypothetical protein
LTSPDARGIKTYCFPSTTPNHPHSSTPLLATDLQTVEMPLKRTHAEMAEADSDEEIEISQIKGVDSFMET